MTKKEIERIIKEADEKLGNYTDAQLMSHLTISKNRRPMNEERKKIASDNGKVLYENKKGIFALSKEENLKNCLLGSLAQPLEAKSSGGKIAGKLRKDKGKPILMIDKNSNEIIKEFITIIAAATFLNKRENKIHDVLGKRRKSAYGFIWKYKDII